MMTDKYKIRILDLAQRWRMDLLTEGERTDLENWYRSLEDKELGIPTETSVNRLEKRLHQLFTNNQEKPDQDGAPPYPF
jgi:hypothetical protein